MLVIIAAVATLASVVSAGVPPPVPVEGACLPIQNDFTKFVHEVQCQVEPCTSNYYVFSEKKLNWAEAKRDCEKNNMELATVLSKEEDQYLRRQILEHAKTVDLAKDPSSPDQFQHMYWMAGETLSAKPEDWVYTRPDLKMPAAKDKEDGWGWAAGRPNAFATQKCVCYFSEIVHNKIAGYDNDDCSKALHYICKSIAPCQNFGQNLRCQGQIDG